MSTTSTCIPAHYGSGISTSQNLASFRSSPNVARNIEVFDSDSEDWVSCLEVSPDGKHLAVGTELGRVRLYEVATGMHEQGTSSHSEAVSVVKWSPDGTCVASSTTRGPVRVWRMATGASTTLATRVAYGAQAKEHIAWSPDSSKLCTAIEEYSVGIWNVSTGVLERRVFCQTYKHRLLHWGTDGKLQAIGRHTPIDRYMQEGNDGSVRETLWKEGSGMFKNLLSRRFQWQRNVFLWYEQSLAWSPNGRYVAMTNRRTDEFSVHKVALTHTEPEGTRKISNSREDVSKVTAAAWSLDSRYLAYSSHDRTVRVWDNEGRREVCVFWEEVFVAHSVAWSPCGGSVLYECGKQVKIRSVSLPQ